MKNALSILLVLNSVVAFADEPGPPVSALVRGSAVASSVVGGGMIAGGMYKASSVQFISPEIDGTAFKLAGAEATSLNTHLNLSKNFRERYVELYRDARLADKAGKTEEAAALRAKADRVQTFLKQTETFPEDFIQLKKNAGLKAAFEKYTALSKELIAEQKNYQDFLGSKGRISPATYHPLGRHESVILADLETQTRVMRAAYIEPAQYLGKHGDEINRRTKALKSTNASRIKSAGKLIGGGVAMIGMGLLLGQVEGDKPVTPINTQEDSAMIQELESLQAATTKPGNEVLGPSAVSGK